MKMKMERERDDNIESSFDSIELNNTFFSVADTDNAMIPLPTSSGFVPLNYNQLFFDFDSHHPFSPLPLAHSSHHLSNFFSQSSHPFNNSYSSSSSSRKRPRFDSSLCPNHLFSPPLQLQRELARQRRQNISDKVRCLQKLMPCDKKMDTATTLEEAYKYVRFLQAQVKALYSMPLESSFALQNDLDGHRCERFGGLEMLNRQQILQVLVNSPVAQTMLYSKGSCILSLEQLILMNKLAQAKLFMQQHHHQ
ncbi:transcription factor bHLH117-like [Mangifera indica]|uniref:transcription factor bHLH117-like n=1 Tax=Mangifera indica TaxID=29780 RepID=UPI001CF9A65A|nr:transcription factor bHLH117-like [Mangifera indica]